MPNLDIDGWMLNTEDMTAEERKMVVDLDWIRHRLLVSFEKQRVYRMAFATQPDARARDHENGGPNE